MGAALRGWGPSTLRFGRRCACLPPLPSGGHARALWGEGAGVRVKLTSPSVQAKCTAVAVSIDDDEGWDTAPTTVSWCQGSLPGGVDFFFVSRLAAADRGDRCPLLGGSRDWFLSPATVLLALWPCRGAADACSVVGGGVTLVARLPHRPCAVASCIFFWRSLGCGRRAQSPGLAGLVELLVVGVRAAREGRRPLQRCGRRRPSAQRCGRRRPSSWCPHSATPRSSPHSASPPVLLLRVTHRRTAHSEAGAEARSGQPPPCPSPGWRRSAPAGSRGRTSAAL